MRCQSSTTQLNVQSDGDVTGTRPSGSGRCRHLSPISGVKPPLPCSAALRSQRPFNSPSVWSAGGTGHCHKQSKKVESLILICQSQQKRNTLCLPVKGHVSLHSIAETASRD